MSWRGIGNFLLPGDPFGKDGPDPQVISDYGAGKYNGQQSVGGYAPGGGMPGMTAPPGDSGGAAYNPWEALSGAGLAQQPGAGFSGYGGPTLDYGNKSLAETQAQYAPMVSSGLATGPFAAGAGAQGNDMSTLEKIALGTQIAGTLGGIYGQWKQGQAQDEDRQRAQDDYERKLREREQAAKDLSPLLRKYLGQGGG